MVYSVWSVDSGWVLLLGDGVRRTVWESMLKLDAEMFNWVHCEDSEGCRIYLVGHMEPDLFEPRKYEEIVNVLKHSLSQRSLVVGATEQDRLGCCICFNVR